MARIAPSILSADFAALGDAVDQVAPQADLLHVDVMDGHFVPNLTIGPPVVSSLRRHTDLYFDCHLMMTNPGRYLGAFQRAGANGCSVHIEVGGTGDLLAEMRRLGLDVGLAVSPETPYEALEPWLDSIDLVLLMTVNPGFGGQPFMPEVIPKIRRTRQEIDRRSLAVAIEVDGGIDIGTVGLAAEAGATVFVAGSAIFDELDPAAAARALRHAADEAAAGGSSPAGASPGAEPGPAPPNARGSAPGASRASGS